MLITKILWLVCVMFNFLNVLRYYNTNSDAFNGWLVATLYSLGIFMYYVLKDSDFNNDESVDDVIDR